MSSSSVDLRWSGQGLVFEGGLPDGPSVTVDSAAEAGMSPTQLLLVSLAACMAIDIRLILEKSRVPVHALEMSVDGERAPREPRRYESIRMMCRLSGPAAGDLAKIDRAVALSRDKYCSVLHTLRPDLDLEIHIQRM